MALKDKEYLCSIDKFGRPKVLEGTSAISLLLLRLILLEPGSDPLHPEMGVGIRRYRFDTEELDVLEKEIKRQSEIYLPDYDINEVHLDFDKNHKLKIDITVNGLIYEIEVADTDKVSLADLQSAY